MIALMISIFVLGYLMIAFEHPLRVNKATFALIMSGVLWTVYALHADSPTVHHDIVMQLGDTCEIVVFLIGAMTIVEHIDNYGGFGIITERINAKDKKKLMWVLSLVTFFMSAVLDNMTTTIIMVMMLRRLIPEQKERWLFAGIIVIAANSGGAWSPIGDVTTIMLWMSEKVTTGSLIVNLLLPSLVSVIIPVMIATRMVSEGEVMRKSNTGTNAQMAVAHPHISKIMLGLGVSGLLFVPLFKTLTGLPPFMGMMISLGVIWLVTEVLISRYHIDPKLGGRVTQAVRHIDMPSILFFLGILMAVSALQQAGVLADVAGAMNRNIHEPYLMTSIIGVLSSIVDNVPLVSACIKMFTGMVDPDPAYMALFVEDGLFWHLLTFCAGVGGSLLIIGSAAGVVAMGIEKIPFFWYVKRITLLALLGYVAGIVLIWLEDICPYITI